MDLHLGRCYICIADCSRDRWPWLNGRTSNTRRLKLKCILNYSWQNKQKINWCWCDVGDGDESNRLMIIYSKERDTGTYSSSGSIFSFSRVYFCGCKYKFHHCLCSWHNNFAGNFLAFHSSHSICARIFRICMEKCSSVTQIFTSSWSLAHWCSMVRWLYEQSLYELVRKTVRKTVIVIRWRHWRQM